MSVGDQDSSVLASNLPDNDAFRELSDDASISSFRMSIVTIALARRRKYSSPG
jgi:hypothetical protein